MVAKPFIISHVEKFVCYDDALIQTPTVVLSLSLHIGLEIELALKLKPQNTIS